MSACFVSADRKNKVVELLGRLSKESLIGVVRDDVPLSAHHQIQSPGDSGTRVCFPGLNRKCFANALEVVRCALQWISPKKKDRDQPHDDASSRGG